MRSAISSARRAFVAAVAITACAVTWAQGLASKPVTIIVPYPAGGVVDIMARTLGQQVSDSIGQPVIVVNRAGANSIIGMQSCAAAQPDGRTLCMTIGDSVVANPLLYANLPYDAEKDFAPVSLLAWSNSMLVASAKAPVSSWPDLVNYAKANPGKLNFGTWGPASAPDVYLQWIERATGLKLLAVPYKGAGQANPALFSGEIDVTLYGVGNALPHIKAGTLKPLVVFGKARSPLLPDVPSLEEVGADPGLAIYFCLFAPAKTPKPLVDKMSAEFVNALKSPKGQELVTRYNLRAEGSTPDDFARLLAQDRANTARVFTTLGIKPGSAPLQ